MVDDNLEDAQSSPESGKARRAPPTIDLEATEVTTAAEPAAEAQAADRQGADQAADGDRQEAAPAAEEVKAETAPLDSSSASSSASPPSDSRSSVSPWVIAPFSGAVAAALVIAIGWMLGWPQVQAPPQQSQAAAGVADLIARVAGLEAKASKPVAPSPDPRVETIDKSLASLRGELANLHAQSDKLAAAVNEQKSAPQDSTTTADLSALNERIAALESASRAQSGAIAQQGEKIVDAEKAAAAKVADDLPLRRLVAASLLDVAVRHGDPYESALATAKSLAENPDALKPLEPFAATGVPNPAMLSRDLLALVPKLSPTAAEGSTTGSGIINRLQAGASRLVKIERTDAVGTDRSAVVARVTAAALHNELAEARHELATLSPADRAAAQGWLDKADARDAALAASRQFADQAMAALARPAQ